MQKIAIFFFNYFDNNYVLTIIHMLINQTRDLLSEPVSDSTKDMEDSITSLRTQIETLAQQIGP